MAFERVQRYAEQRRMGFGQLPVRRWLPAPLIPITCLLIALAPGVSAAQPDTQLWSEFTLEWIKSHRLTYSVDFEPKVLIWAPAGDPGWATLDVTPKIEYTVNQWVVVGSELLVGWTKQTNDQNSVEITPRLDVRFHLLGTLIDAVVKEKRPRHRLVMGNLTRLEWRNLYYSDDTPSQSTLRLRERIVMQLALTRPRVTDNGATYLVADWEWFWPEDDPDERYANKQRIRMGLGYRHSFAWRFEALYILNRSRNSVDEGFTTSDNIIDLIVKRVW
jgi:hypothetical protein